MKGLNVLIIFALKLVKHVTILFPNFEASREGGLEKVAFSF